MSEEDNWKWQKELLIKRDKEHQEEIERLNKVIEYAKRIEKDYKTKFDRAIEYIEEYQEILKEHNEDWLNYQDGFKPYLLNILKGSDKE